MPIMYINIQLTMIKPAKSWSILLVGGCFSLKSDMQQQSYDLERS